MNEFTNKQLFCKALEEVQQQRITSFLNQDIDFTPSFRFEKKMLQLISSQKHGYWKYINSTAKRVAVILLTTLFLFSGSMTVKAIREPVIQFFAQTWETFTRIFTSETTSLTPDIPVEMRYYTFSQLPEGFVIKENQKDKLGGLTIWEHVLSNNEIEEIIFNQSMISTDKTINTEGVELTEVELNGVTMLTYVNKGIRTIIWNENGYEFSLSCPGRFTLEELSGIFNYMTEIE